MENQSGKGEEMLLRVFSYLARILVFFISLIRRGGLTLEIYIHTRTRYIIRRTLPTQITNEAQIGREEFGTIFNFIIIWMTELNIKLKIKP